MKKCIRKSIDLAYDLFPEAYKDRENYRTFHFATLCKRNRIVSVGQNHPNQLSSKALYFAKRFGTRKKIQYPSLHAEIDCISKAWSKVYIDSSFTLVSIRLNRWGEFRMGKPCDDCRAVLNGLGILDVYWTTNEGIHSD